jgi:hypothetical protein
VVRSFRLVYFFCWRFVFFSVGGWSFRWFVVFFGRCCVVGSVFFRSAVWSFWFPCGRRFGRFGGLYFFRSSVCSHRFVFGGLVVSVSCIFSVGGFASARLSASICSRSSVCSRRFVCLLVCIVSVGGLVLLVSRLPIFSVGGLYLFRLPVCIFSVGGLYFFWSCGLYYFGRRFGRFGWFFSAVRSFRSPCMLAVCIFRLFLVAVWSFWLVFFGGSVVSIGGLYVCWFVFFRSGLVGGSVVSVTVYVGSLYFSVVFRGTMVMEAWDICRGDLFGACVRRRRAACRGTMVMEAWDICRGDLFGACAVFMFLKFWYVADRRVGGLYLYLLGGAAGALSPVCRSFCSVPGTPRPAQR